MLMQTRRLARVLAAAAALWAATACGPSLMATRPEVHSPGAVRVALKSLSDDLFKFVVVNESPYPLVIYRDAVRLATATGTRSRLPGGLAHIYHVPPGGYHDVHVKFPLGGIRQGETVWVHFQQALLINGQPVAVEPLEFVMR
ncbi:MAG: hypothetical protein RMK29_14870 [Myxococcales bacterium]|nr:hypothetical protein [Myxococcota bacterium]MDW8282996.1 hypothetical protein [Myxococcales bacterium]